MNFGFQDRNKPKPLGICILLTALVFLVYGQTVHHGFVHYDDYYYVSDNPHVTGGVTLAAVVGAFSSREGLWTPLVTISHMIDWQFYRTNAGGHHLTNVLLHLASVILLFLILRRMTGAHWRSAFVAAAFAIHPLNVESVAWIAERKDVLSGLFFMLTLGAYLRYVERPESLGRALCVILMFSAGLMSKPMLVTLPFVLLLLDYWPLNRLSRPALAGSGFAEASSIDWRVFVEKIPLLVLSIAACAVTAGGPAGNPAIDMVQVPFSIRMGEAPASFVIYLREMFWPSGLTLIYTHYEESLPWWPAALALLASVSLGIFLWRRRVPYLWMGWLWTLGMLVPASGIVQVSRHTRADHYNYLPQIGLYIGLTWAIADWAAAWRNRRAVLGGAAAAVLFALVVAAWRQTSYWRDDMALWTHALACTRDNSFAHDELGDALIAQGQTHEGIAELREALQINPISAMAHNDLGIALSQQGQAEQGIAEFREALRINPTVAEFHCNLGRALMERGRTGQGLAEYHEALRINPCFARARCSLGAALVRQGRMEEGIAQFREALKINPAYADARDSLANALVAQGQTEEGMAELRRVLRDNPASAAAHNDLGIALFRQGQADEGIAEFREASKIDPGFAEAHCNLGSALLDRGRPLEAIPEFREALRINPAYQRAHDALSKALLDHRQTGEPDSGAKQDVEPEPAKGRPSPDGR